MDIKGRSGAFLRWGTDWHDVDTVNLIYRFSIEEKKGILKYLLQVKALRLTPKKNLISRLTDSH